MPPIGFRPIRFTWPWSIPAWAPIGDRLRSHRPAKQFIAPDNGLLSPARGPYPPAKIVRLTTRVLVGSRLDNLHGRDIMAPVAAHLALGLDPRPPRAPLPRLTAIDCRAAGNTPSGSTAR